MRLVTANLSFLVISLILPITSSICISTNPCVINGRLPAASAFTIGAYSTTPMAFYTNSSERMRITSSGDVLMGKSAQDAAVDGLQYRGAAPGLVQITRAGGEALQLWRYTSNGKMLVFYYAGSEVGSISSNTLFESIP